MHSCIHMGDRSQCRSYLLEDLAPLQVYASLSQMLKAAEPAYSLWKNWPLQGEWDVSPVRKLGR